MNQAIVVAVTEWWHWPFAVALSVAVVCAFAAMHVLVLLWTWEWSRLRGRPPWLTFAFVAIAVAFGTYVSIFSVLYHIWDSPTPLARARERVWLEQGVVPAGPRLVDLLPNRSA